MIDSPIAGFKTGFVSILGRPNSGKSTLMNAVLGEQLSIVSALPQTTRKNMRGIYTDDAVQIVFLDTPGIHNGKHLFNQKMIEQGRSALKKGDVDVVCYVVDCSRSFGEEEDVVANMVGSVVAPVLIVFNKIDICPEPAKVIQGFFDRYTHFGKAIRIMVSATDAEATRALFLKAIVPLLPVCPAMFAADDLTDASLRFFASEYIRKQVIHNTQEEVPHACFVEIMSYSETPEKHVVEATIHVETIGQRGIIVGPEGKTMEKINHFASKDLEKLTGVKAKIKCHVVVTPDWRNDGRFLKEMGFGG